MAYSFNIEDEADYAKARVEDTNASFKDLAEVCYNIRGRPADIAVDILEEAKAGKIPLRYRSHNTRMAHRKELQGQKGRWPIKCAGIVLKCLQSAIANAKEKGLSEELVVVHASANKKRSYMRYASKGRRNTSKFETARVEIVLREKVEGKKKRIAEQKKAAEEKKKAEAAKKAEEAKAPKPMEAKPVETKPGEIKAAPDKAAAKAEAEAPPAKAVGEKTAEAEVEVPKPVAKPDEAKKEEAKPKVEEKPAAKTEEKKAAPAEAPEKKEPKDEVAKTAEAKVEKKEPPKATPPKKEEKKDEVA